MVRVQDIQAVGISRATIYYRARKLGLDGEPGRPLRFTKEQVRRILAYKPERSGRKRKIVVRRSSDAASKPGGGG